MGMHAQDDLDRMLTRLELTAMGDRLDSLLDEAVRGEMTLRDALAFLCEREIARKERAIVRHRSEDDGERRIDMSFGLAKFPFVRDLTSFDHAARPSVDRDRIRDLATGRFIADGDALLLLGPPGVGKTHPAVAPGREAIVAGYTMRRAEGARPARHRRDGTGGEPGRGTGREPSRGAADALRQAEAADRGRARMPAAGAGCRASVLPARLAALRARRDALASGATVHRTVA